MYLKPVQAHKLAYCNTTSLVSAKCPENASTAAGPSWPTAAPLGSVANENGVYRLPRRVSQYELVRTAWVRVRRQPRQAPATGTIAANSSGYVVPAAQVPRDENGRNRLYCLTWIPHIVTWSDGMFATFHCLWLSLSSAAASSGLLLPVRCGYAPRVRRPIRRAGPAEQLFR